LSVVSLIFRNELLSLFRLFAITTKAGATKTTPSPLNIEKQAVHSPLLQMFAAKRFWYELFYCGEEASKRQ
jgi:hypothetical protein